MALNGLFLADVPLKTHLFTLTHSDIDLLTVVKW